MTAQPTSEVWFQTSDYSRTVDPVVVERVTESSVWIKGKRHNRLGYDSFFPTKSDAWNWKINRQIARRDSAQRQVDYEQERLDKIYQYREQDNV